MSILAANLKHLYQRRGAWLWYFIILGQTPIIYLSIRSKAGRYLGYLLISYFSGMIVGSLQKEISSKPFSFCLPGHSEIPRRFIFWVGVVLNGLLGLVFMFCPEPEFSSVFFVVLAGGVVGMIAYLFSAGLMLYDLDKSKMGWIFLPVVFCGVFLKWDLVVQKMIITSPLIVTSLGLLICWLVYRLLGKESLRRKYCGKLVIGMFGAWNWQKIEKIRQQKMSKKGRKYQAVFSNWLERIFRNFMERYDFLSTGKYVCGNIYMVLGGCSRMLRPGIAVLLAFGIVVYFGYLGSIGSGKAGPSMMMSFVYILPALFLVNINLLPCPSLLVPAGRSQKFYAMLAMVMVLTFLGVILMLALTGISLSLERHLPDIKWQSLVLSYHAFDVRLLPLFFVFIPISFCANVLFRKNFIVRMIIVMVLLQIMIFAGVTGLLMNIRFGPSLLAMLAVVFWGLFLYVLRYVCMRRSLVGQGR